MKKLLLLAAICAVGYAAADDAEDIKIRQIANQADSLHCKGTWEMEGSTSDTGHLLDIISIRPKDLKSPKAFVYYEYKKQEGGMEQGGMMQYLPVNFSTKSSICDLCDIVIKNINQKVVFPITFNGFLNKGQFKT